MFFYIKQWPDKTATLMVKNGAALWTFCSVEEARQVCRDWYNIHKENVDLHLDQISEDRGGFDPACASCAVG